MKFSHRLVTIFLQNYLIFRAMLTVHKFVISLFPFFDVCHWLCLSLPKRIMSPYGFPTLPIDFEEKVYKNLSKVLEA